MEKAKLEKEQLAINLENEEECLTNNLQRQLRGIQIEKEQIEVEVESLKQELEKMKQNREIVSATIDLHDTYRNTYIYI